jgi:hypothetical protein
MSTQPAAPTAAEIAAIQNKFRVAFVTSFPPPFWETITGLESKSPSAIFQILEEPGGALSLSNATLPAAERTRRANLLYIAGYGGLMLYPICWQGLDPWDVFEQWGEDGIDYYPPRYIKGVIQPNPGEPGQVALPNDFHANMGLLGPWPTTPPEGWVKVPPVAQLLVPGADVDALLKAWF